MNIMSSHGSSNINGSANGGGSVPSNIDVDDIDVKLEVDEESGSSDESTYIGDNHRASILRDSRPAYDFRRFIPSIRNPLSLARWLATGVAPDDSVKPGLTEVEVDENTRKAARMLSLLREYHRRFGMPPRGGPRDEQWVLTELCRGLYSGGTPLWTLRPVMSKAAEGLTGARGVEFCLFPRSAFVFAPTSGATIMFPMERGFSISTLTYMEKVLVRLASFATNTRAVHNVDSDAPKVAVLMRAARGQSVQFGLKYREEALAKEILDLASEGMGLFYLTSHAEEMQTKAGSDKRMQSFWEVGPHIKELFARLATMEADRAIGAIREKEEARALYPRPVLLLCRFVSSAGAAGLWFSASWLDMLVAGAMGVVVALVQGASLWEKHERMLMEVCASWAVGVVAGLLSMSFADSLCFGGMAVAAVIDILQGFRVVYSVMEIMSRHTVAGGADFLEGVLFTGLISYFLKFGLGTAKAILSVDQADMDFNVCSTPINPYFYFLLVPITSFAWALLFKPRYKDVPLMMYHGILSFTIHWAVSAYVGNSALATFVAALATTASAGIMSRFTGRQALGDTVTGLYVLMPGAYLVKGLFAAAEENVVDSTLLGNIIVMAVTIGLGSWAGTLLCSPTILGTNRGMLKKSVSTGSMRRRPSTISEKEKQARAMLFF